MSNLSLVELLSKCNDLKTIGIELGFNVKEQNQFFCWSSQVLGELLVYPVQSFALADMNLLAATKSNLSDTVIIVSFNDSDRRPAEPLVNTYWGTLRDLRAILDWKKSGEISEKGFAEIWHILFSTTDLSAILTVRELLRNKSRSDKTDILETTRHQEGHKAKRSNCSIPKYPLGQYIKTISSALNCDLHPSEKQCFIDSASEYCVLLLVSKEYQRAKEIKEYWYSIRKYQNEILKKYNKSYIAFCLTEKSEILLFSFDYIESLLDKLPVSPHNGDPYWHVKFRHNDNQIWLLLKGEEKYSKNKRKYLEDNSSSIMHLNFSDSSTKAEAEINSQSQPTRLKLGETQLREINFRTYKIR